MGARTTMVSRTSAVLLLCTALFASFLVSADAKCDTRVCEKFYNGVYETIKDSEWQDEVAIENRITKWCKANTVRPFDKMCYYIEGIKRKISKDLKMGAPAELACKRLGQKDEAICTLKEPRKLDANMDLSKMRVKQLRELMQEFGVDCPNCLEKSDMIQRIQSTIMGKKEL